MSHKFPIKVIVIKRKFCLLSKAPLFPKTGPLWKQTPISIALFSISFGVLSKGALPPGSPHGAPPVRDAPFPEPCFIHLSKSLVKSPLPGSLAGTYGERCSVSRAYLVRGSYPSRYKRFISSPKLKKPTQFLIQRLPALFRGFGWDGKRPGRDVDHSLPSSVEIKNEWR